MILKQLQLFLGILTISQLVQSRPEKNDCEWVPTGEVTRIRDLDDCTKFYYCAKGKAPFQVSCPKEEDHTSYYLYFNPETTECDVSWKAPADCFSTGTGTGNYNYVTYQTTTTTTEATTTTTRAPRPPTLDDQPDFEIDCSQKVCGLFPNAYGDCNTYVVCVNGEKITKKCNGGQLFDAKTRECQPANMATCWTEPNAGPHIRKNDVECPYHENAPAEPIEKVSNGVILQNPVVTNWGSWQTWEECPKGMYATGIYAWRRLLMQAWKSDQAGIVSVSFICQTPGGNETKDIIESLAPGLPHDGWPFYYMCSRGAVVGVRLNSVGNNAWGNDNLATDNIQGLCSCSSPVYKSYDDAKFYPQNGNRGAWTDPQYCKKGQAICGMQTQMQDYREYLVGQYDNTGLNNIKVKCCDVPDPLKKCVPKEDRLLVRVCDNSKSDEGLRCDFEAEIGLSLDYDTNQKLVDFYSSIGYTFDDAKKLISSRIMKNFENRHKLGIIMQYDWDDAPQTLMEDAKVSSKTMHVKPFEKVDLYQIVGRCGHFLVRTNRYMRVVRDGKTGRLKPRTYFEI